MVKDLFMALLMITARMNPEDPSSAPATIRTWLFRTKPSAAADIPAYEFSIAMTVGMSAPPMAITRRKPKRTAKPAMNGRM